MNGAVTVAGVSPGSLYHLRITPGSTSGYVEADYFTNRTARDTETMVGDLYLVPTAILSGFVSPIPPDPKKPIVSLRILDCLGQPADGVTVSIPDPPSDLVIGYVQATMLPDYQATATGPTGYVAVVNPKVDSLVTFNVKSGTKNVITYQVVMQGQRTVMIDLFPGWFSY